MSRARECTNASHVRTLSADISPSIASDQNHYVGLFNFAVWSCYPRVNVFKKRLIIRVVKTTLYLMIALVALGRKFNFDFRMLLFA